MSQWEKLLSRLKALSPDMRFEELRKILLNHGYRETQPKEGSSHHIFRKEKEKIVIPKYKPVLKVHIAIEKRRKRSEKGPCLLHGSSLQNRDHTGR